MASSQKKTKKTTKPAEAKTTTRRRKEAAPAPEPKRTYRREIGAAVCLLSALCVAVSYFNTDAFFLAIFATLIKGLFGYGYWLAAPVLAVAGVNLLRGRQRPVVLRTVCTLSMPVVVGVLCHVLLCRQDYALSFQLVAQLWREGQSLLCGGVVSGALASAGSCGSCVQ